MISRTFSLIPLAVLTLAACAPSATDSMPDTGTPETTSPTPNATTRNTETAPPVVPMRAPVREVTTGDILTIFPGDPACFTQGFEIARFEGENPIFYESCGQYGASEFATFAPVTGERQAAKLPADVFAEGFTWIDASNSGLQLTWREGTVFRQPGTQPVGKIPTEGWGICYDTASENVWISDGSATITSYDPATLEPAGPALIVTDAGIPIANINELECARGVIWANVWLTNVILKIDPSSGHVLETLDLTAIVNAETERQGPLDSNQTLNGSAIDNDRVFVTGKQWEAIYELDPSILN